MADTPADRLRKALERRSAHHQAMREHAAELGAQRETERQARLEQIDEANLEYERAHPADGQAA